MNITNEQIDRVFEAMPSGVVGVHRQFARAIIAEVSCTNPRFSIGQRVRKTKGSEWQGCIVGWYSTALTPEGYAVESEAHNGSVQIYPASALEAVPE